MTNKTFNLVAPTLAMCLIACTAQLLIAVAAAQETPSIDYADSIFHNGRIYTVDDDRSWVEAVAIKGGRFQAVGSDDAVLTLRGPGSLLRDLNGAMAMPGIHDAHFHLHSVRNSIECSPGQFPPERLAVVLEQCRTRINPEYPWLIINGMEMWSGEELSNELINIAYPDLPVIIRDVSLHTLLVNDAALAIAEINSDTPEPEGGKILKHPQNGRPTGILAEMSAMELVAKHVPPYSNELVDKQMASLARALLRQGITSLQEAATDRQFLESVIRLDEKGSPLPYVFNHLRWTYPEGPSRDAQETLIDDRDKYKSEHLSLFGIKVFLDGVPVPPAFTHVPLNEDGRVDESNLLVPRDVLYKKLIEWDRAGLKVKMHAAGYGSVRVGLDAIGATREENSFSGILHEIGHTSGVSEADLPRFAEINAVAEISPYFWHLGGVVGQTGYQFRSLYESGALITIGSDYAVVESYNPFPPLQGILTRDSDSVPIEVALDFVTRNAAVSIGRVDDMGTIETGKIANMIVLDRNLLEVPTEEIGDTQVLMTILDGAIVYGSQQFAVN